MKELRDRVAVVTGAAGGIGQALATRFAAEGMRVVLADIDPAALTQTEVALKRTGATTLAVPTDVSRIGDVEALAQQTVAAFGAVHVLCNNAGVGSAGTAWETPLAEWERVIGVNLWGVIHGLQVFVPLMLAQGGAGGGEGHVVNTASIAGLTSSPFMAAYNATKHAVIAISESLAKALEVLGAPIRVSVLCPGVVNTPICRRAQNVQATLQSPRPEAIAFWEQLRDRVAQGMPPAEVADHVVRAIRGEQFYILTHRDSRDGVRTRLEDILDGRTPSIGRPPPALATATPEPPARIAG
jgi:NAD(P)-dependent dehydrogenase (short-subunit alcohol dehydrogenase family)